MIVMSGTRGSGGTFICSRVGRYGWLTCIRPDKINNPPGKVIEGKTIRTYKSKTRAFFRLPSKIKRFTDKELFKVTYKELKHHKLSNKIMLFCTRWGGFGYLTQIEEKPIYVVRNPVFAFNSDSGGGWRIKKGRVEHIKQAGGPIKWAELWFGEVGLWMAGTQYALDEYKKGKAYVVRYNRFEEDWLKIGKSVPPIYKDFVCKDEISRVKEKFSIDVIDYIKAKTDSLWEEIEKI